MLMKREVRAMRIRVYSNRKPTSRKVTQELLEKLRKAGFILDKKSPDVVITIGGDGTLLSAFHAYESQLDTVRFIGVHTGHLGFYTDWRDYEIDELVRSLKEEKQNSVSYPLLDVCLTYTNNMPDRHFLALNEATIKNVDRTMVANVFIKDELFECYRGDGLSVSTPTGSTAYSKSLGGAVVHPRVNTLQLNEIASLNNRVYRSLGSPMIIAPDEWIRLDMKKRETYSLHVDNLSLTNSNIKHVKFCLSEKRIHFALYRHTHFWRRVNNAFIGTSKESSERL